MKFLPVIALMLVASLRAQSVSQEPVPDPVMDAIHELTGEKTEASPSSETDAKPEKTEAAAPAVEDAAPADKQLESPPVVEPPAGLRVNVEKYQANGNKVDPKKVKLLAPFPAKLLSPAPAGWHLEVSDSAPPFTREVEVAPGARITLTIRPHVLVPEADGAHTFSIKETGYDPALGYGQTGTVGAILSNSVRRLDEDAKRLNAVVDNLQQLLVSLPKPEPVQPAIQPEVSKPAPPVRKR